MSRGRSAPVTRGAAPPLRVIWNARAGHKGGIPTGGATEEVLRDVLLRHGLRTELLPSESEDDCRRLAREAVEQDRPIVVAAGGDGTIGCVAGVLEGTPTALGMLPLGSVMNIPRMLGVPRDPAAAAEVLANGEIRLIDVGEANGRLFYEAASVGLNATFFSAAERLMERDYLSLRRLLWIALRYRPARIRLQLDDDTVETRALMVTVSNGPYTGLGMTVAPTASIDDGRFDVRVFRHYSKWELLRHLLSISFGRRRYTPHTNTYRTTAVRIEARRSLPVRVDGVNIGRTPLECRVRRASLRVMVPRDEADEADRADAGAD